MPRPPAPCLPDDPLASGSLTGPLDRSLDEVVVDGPLAFEEVYREHFDFVFRNSRRLGIRQDEVDDVVQDVFLVVHRRLPSYEPRAPIRAWIYQILVLVSADHRRRARRKQAPLLSDGDGEHTTFLPADADDGPDRQMERADGLRTLWRVLSTLSEDKRTVFVLVELEEMSIPEIAVATGDNVNTLYTRLRAARREFERTLSQLQAQPEGVVR